MPTITTNSWQCYARTATNSKSYTGTGSDPTYATAAGYAQYDANEAANAHSGLTSPTITDGGQAYDYNYFGSNNTTYSRGEAKVTKTVTPTPTDPNFYVTASCIATASGYAAQIKINFTLPNGLTAANIASATLTYRNYPSWTSGSKTFYVCAPKTAHGGKYYKPSGSSVIEKKESFSVAGRSASYADSSITITNAFKQCLTNGQGYIVLARDVTTANDNSYVYITGTPTITYTLTNTPTGAPTTVTFTPAVKPGGDLTISWSGATAGTNNSITGYDIYYKIGSAPTTSSYDGHTTTDASTTSATFTISGSAARKSVFYAIIQTQGQAGSNYYSTWKSANGGAVNSLPAKPIASASATRIRSDGQATSITFSTQPGDDADSSQLNSRTVYYATSTSGTKTLVPNNSITLQISATGTYYFWTYDSLEYSSEYESITITQNVAPTIESVTMSAVATYTPVTRDGYVTNINGSANGVTGTNLSYQWKLCIGNTAAATSYGDGVNISTDTSISNYDVTSCAGMNFNKSYKLKLVVTDDLGESAQAISSNVFAIPAAPTLSNIYNQFANSNANNTNSAHYENGVRFVFSQVNTGITRSIQYSTDQNFTSYTTESITNPSTIYTDINLSNLVRGSSSQRYFRIQQYCGLINNQTNITYITEYNGYPIIFTRTADITPSNITETAAEGATIRPYIHSTFNVSYSNQPHSFEPANDVSSTSTDIYSFALVSGSQSITLTSTTITNSQVSVTATLDLSSITTTEWKSLLSLTNAPNTQYPVSLRVNVTNGFGQTFSNSKSITLNFIEGFGSAGTPTLSIQTGANSYTNIPSDLQNRYPTFETQTLRMTISGIQVYANQTAEVYVLDGNDSIAQVSIVATDWTAPTGSSKLYTLATSKSANWTLGSSNTTVNKNYRVRIILQNAQETIISNTSNLNTTAHQQFTPQNINFTLTGSSEQSQVLSVDWNCTNYGGADSTTYYSVGYSAITGRIVWSDAPSGTYTEFTGTDDITLSDIGTQNIAYEGTVNGISMPANAPDIVYLGVKLKVTLGFQSIGNNVPTGTKEYTYSYLNRQTLYRTVPNLLYGKNFFVINASQPKGTSDELMTIRPTDNRNKLYIGLQGYEGTFEITATGLKIDGGSWNT